MPAQRVDSAPRPSHIPEQELQHRRRSNDLRAKRMLRPSDGVNNRPRLLHIAVFANRGIELGGLEELFLGDPSDALDHLRRIPRIVLLQKLEDTVGILQREVVIHFFRQ